MISSNKELKNFYDNQPQLKSSYRELRNRYYAKIPYKDAMLELLSMVGVDQSLRSLLGTLEFKKVDSLIHSNDTTNMASLMKIIAQIGFPDRRKVGKAGADATFILLMHTLNNGKNEAETWLRLPQCSLPRRNWAIFHHFMLLFS